MADTYICNSTSWSAAEWEIQVYLEDCKVYILEIPTGMCFWAIAQELWDWAANIWIQTFHSTELSAASYHPFRSCPCSAQRRGISACPSVSPHEETSHTLPNPASAAGGRTGCFYILFFDIFTIIPFEKIMKIIHSNYLWIYHSLSFQH